MQFDWDDAMGNKARHEAGLRLEKLRQVRSLLLLCSSLLSFLWPP